jgi:hypothetical protein
MSSVNGPRYDLRNPHPSMPQVFASLAIIAGFLTLVTFLAWRDWHAVMRVVGDDPLKLAMAGVNNVSPWSWWPPAFTVAFVVLSYWHRRWEREEHAQFQGE